MKPKVHVHDDDDDHPAVVHHADGRLVLSKWTTVHHDGQGNWTVIADLHADGHGIVIEFSDRSTWPDGSGGHHSVREAFETTFGRGEGWRDVEHAAVTRVP